MKKLLLIVVWGLPIAAVPAAASEEALELCEQLEELVIERSAADVTPTRRPLIRHYEPEQNYIWCLGIGFASLDEKVNAFILSFGREPDGSLWLDFWDKRETPSFKWTN